jgi:hypothetical protein
LHGTSQTVQVKAEEVTQHVLEGTAALQSQAAQVAERVEVMVHQAVGSVVGVSSVAP